MPQKSLFFNIIYVFLTFQARIIAKSQPWCAVGLADKGGSSNYCVVSDLQSDTL